MSNEVTCTNCGGRGEVPRMFTYNNEFITNCEIRMCMDCCGRGVTVPIERNFFLDTVLHLIVFLVVIIVFLIIINT